VANYKYHYDPAPGMQWVIRAVECGLELIDLGFLQLGPNQEFSDESGESERVLVIQAGRADISVGETTWHNLGGRASVFDGRATAVYVPHGHSYTVRALTDLTVAVAAAPSDLDVGPAVITPDKVRVIPSGAYNWRRDVHVIMGEEATAGRLYVGETFGMPGCWSSYPPHKHEVDDLPREVKQEEVYYFKFKPSQGFGFQRLYTDDGSMDEALLIKENDIAVLPRGYHPTASAPGYSIYYLFVLAGRHRLLLPHDDPQHAWVKNAETILKAAKE